MLSTSDRVEISETLALHAHIADSNQLDRLGELFTPDAVYDMSAVGIGAFEGIDVIGAAAARMAESGRAPLEHYVTNIVITSTGDDAATVQSKGLMIMSTGAVHGVRYDDTLRRQGDGWRISRRIITPASVATSGGDH